MTEHKEVPPGSVPQGRRWLQLHSDIQRSHPPGNSPAGSRRSRSSGRNPGCAVCGGGSSGAASPTWCSRSPSGKVSGSVPRPRPRCVGPTLVSGLWPGCVGPAVCVAGVAVCGMGGRRRVVSPSASPVRWLLLVVCGVGWGRGGPGLAGLCNQRAPKCRIRGSPPSGLWGRSRQLTPLMSRVGAPRVVWPFDVPRGGPQFGLGL